MSALDTKRLRALAVELAEARAASDDARHGRPATSYRAAMRAAEAGHNLADALTPDVVLALLDRLERAERIAPSVEAGELVETVLRECGVGDSNDGSNEDVARAARLVQRALDAAEERGAKAEREQRDIERRHGAGR